MIRFGRKTDEGLGHLNFENLRCSKATNQRLIQNTDSLLPGGGGTLCLEGSKKHQGTSGGRGAGALRDMCVKPTFWPVMRSRSLPVMIVF